MRDDCPAEVRSIQPSSFTRPLSVCANMFLSSLVSLIGTGQEEAATVGSHLFQFPQRCPRTRLSSCAPSLFPDLQFSAACEGALLLPSLPNLLT
jgi:hypothetical protein